MSSPHPNERRTPDPKHENDPSDRPDPAASGASSSDHLPSLGQVPSVAQSDTQSSSLSFGDFTAELSVREPLLGVLPIPYLFISSSFA